MEIVRWISLVLLWIAMGINVWGVAKSSRLIREYQNKPNKLLELMREKQNENTES